jgi:hypothetical protein
MAMLNGRPQQSFLVTEPAQCAESSDKLCRVRALTRHKLDTQFSQVTNYLNLWRSLGESNPVSALRRMNSEEFVRQCAVCSSQGTVRIQLLFCPIKTEYRKRWYEVWYEGKGPHRICKKVPNLLVAREGLEPPTPGL